MSERKRKEYETIQKVNFESITSRDASVSSLLKIFTTVSFMTEALKLNDLYCTRRSHSLSLDPVRILQEVEPNLMSACHGNVQQVVMGGVRGFPQCKVPRGTDFLFNSNSPTFFVVALTTSTSDG